MQTITTFPDVQGRTPLTPDVERRREPLPDSHQALERLFDSYLDVVHQATRCFGRLFPYRQVRLSIQRLLAGSHARVVVLGSDRTILAEFDISCSEGSFRRVHASSEAACTWSLDLTMLQSAAADPQAYLTQPQKLDFAWFFGDATNSTASRW